MSDPISELTQTNATLRNVLELLANPTPGATAKYFADLRRELSRAQRLRQEIASAPAAPGASSAQIEYRNTLEKLQAALSSLQGRMLVERARLDRDRSHWQAAADWRRSMQQIYR